MDFSFKDIVEHAHDIIIVTKADPIDLPGPEIVYVNKAFTELTGYTSSEVIGKTPRILQGEDTCPETRHQIREALKNKMPIRVSVKNYTKDKKPYWLDLNILPLRNFFGQVTHYVAIERDITNLKKEIAELSSLSMRDPLTNLYNRRAVIDLMKKEFARFRREEVSYSVLVFDIDWFKDVNDNYGHAKGDEVINAVGQIITSHLREQDWVARTGGEEFVAILINADIDGAAATAERIRSAVAATIFESETSLFQITISIGLSMPTLPDEDEWQASSRADKALYDAKSMGRNRLCIR